DYGSAAQTYNDGLNGLLAELGPVPRKGQATIFLPKVDWTINSKNHASFEVNRMRWASPAGIQTQASNTFGIASFGNDYVRDTWGVAKLYTSFTPSLSNEARFQYGRDLEFEFAQPSSAYEQATFITSPLLPGYTNPLGFEFNTGDYAFFAEDNWRILPRFTLNIGVRYEYEKLPDPILANPAVPQTQQLPSDQNNVGPRIGFAWDVTGDGKTSVRGGYGVFFGRIINSTVYNALTNTGIQGGQFSFFFTPTTLNAPSLPQILSTQPGSPSGLNITFFDKNFQAPSVQQTDLTFEREIARNTVVSVSYLGSFGRSLPDFVDINTGAPTTTINYTVGAGGPLPAGTYSTPLFATIITKPSSGPSTTVSPRTNHNFGAMSEIFSGVSSTYNALALQLNRKMTNHLQFTANYTWAHSLDYGQNASTFSDTNDLLVPTDIRGEHGNSIFDVRNRFVASAVAESPWHVRGIFGYFVNDWLLAPIYS